MSIVASDILFKLSGGTTNPSLSLGGAISSTSIVDNSLENLFNNVTGDQHSAGFTSYRCFYVKNNHATLTAYNTVIWIHANASSADESIQIGIEASKGSPVQTIANETTAPTGISFSTASSQATGLSIGSLAPSEVYAVWVKRIITSGTTPYSADTATLKLYIDTL